MLVVVVSGVRTGVVIGGVVLEAVGDGVGRTYGATGCVVVREVLPLILVACGGVLTTELLLALDEAIDWLAVLFG